MKQMRRFVRRWLSRVVCNTGIMTAVFFGAAFLEGRVAPWWSSDYPEWPLITSCIIWFAALVVAYPLLRVNFNKLKASAIMFAELTIATSDNRKQTRARRAVLAGVSLLVGLLVHTAWFLLMLCTVFFPYGVLIALPLLYAFQLSCMGQRFCDYFNRPWVPLPKSADPVMPRPSKTSPIASSPTPKPKSKPKLHTPLLKSQRPNSNATDIDFVTLTEAAAAVGKPLGALKELRGTGVRVAGIVRNGKNIANPEPNLQLHTGDQVLLSGTDKQLAAARSFLLLGRIA